MPVEQIVQSAWWGNVALVACTVVYLAWWAVTFRPENTSPLWLKVVLFVPTAALGLVGAWQLVMAFAPAQAANLPFAIGAVVAYVALLVITRVAFKRQVTSELFLICLWAGMECALVNTLVLCGTWDGGVAVAAYVLVGVMSVAALASYLAYDRLKPWPAFYVAMVPLALIGITCLVLAVLVGT
ncbi:MAG: hypothetical protein Q4E12_05580 [Coriobacteriia bacterium]|nr:hypothetical protein [Coriobacteriia bacterium]